MSSKPIVVAKDEFLRKCVKKCKYVNECPVFLSKRNLPPEQLKDWIKKHCFQANKIAVRMI